MLNVPIFIDGSHWGVLEVDTVEKTAFEEFEVHSSRCSNIIGLTLGSRASQAEVLKAAAETVNARGQTEILLRELQHRMKNNLQVIVSLLALQRRQAAGEEACERISSVMDRVLAIGLAQDQLTFKESASTVKMHDYLKALCANIDPRRPQIAIEVDADVAGIPLDRAVPVGLIVNELVTNSVKYAFDEEGGIINVVFRVNATIGEGEVSVRDNGRGMGPPRKGALGLLAESLGRPARWAPRHARCAEGFADDTNLPIFSLMAGSKGFPPATGRCCRLPRGPKLSALFKKRKRSA